jgi:hypothetical protein
MALNPNRIFSCQIVSFLREQSIGPKLWVKKKGKQLFIVMPILDAADI